MFPAKQGDDFALVGTVKLPAGSWAVAGQAKREGSPTRYDLVVTLGVIVNGQAVIAVEASKAATATWPAGTLQADLKFTDTATGLVAHTSRFEIDVATVVTL